MSLNPSSFLFLPGIQSWISITIIFFLFAIPLAGQSRTSIKENQDKLKAEITLTQSNLKKLEKDKSINIDRYETLKKQIKSRNALISSYEAELDLIEANLIAQEADLTLVKSQFDIQKARYQEAVRDFYKIRNTYSPLSFILSSKDFTTAWKRMIFYRSLSRYHKSELSKLSTLEEKLLLHLSNLKLSKAEKLNTLEQVKLQKSKLSATQSASKSELDRLTKNTSFLQNRLKAQEAQSVKLTAMLQSLVSASIKKKSSSKSLATTTDNLNNAFGSNKGKLPWPVANGYIGKKFGKQRHPDLKMIFITNNGIDIVTEIGEPILAVFDGRVTAIQTVAGFKKTILVNHGNYYTVYANVDDVTISNGEEIKRGQTIAFAADSDGSTSIHFELWKGKQLQNPSVWLKRK